MKDIINARRALKPKIDKGKKRASSTKAPSFALVSRPAGVPFLDLVVDTTYCC